MEVREFEIREVKADKREITGIAVPWDEVADIGGEYKESWQRGAFEDNAEATLFYAHDHKTGQTPIGRVINGRSTDEGYEVTAHISETTKGNEIYALLKDKVLNKFSIGFEPVKHETRDGVVVRTAAKLRELSIVPMAAFEGANIALVRNEKENEMETEVKDSPKVLELSNALAELERKVTVINERGNDAGKGGIQFRDSGAELLKALADGDEQAQMEFRAFTGANTGDSVVKAAWVDRGLKLVAINRKGFNLFGHKALPATGNTIEYPVVSSSTGTVAEQVAEGNDLTYSEVVLTTATAPVKTYGGYVSLSKQVIQRSTVPFLETSLDYLARQYGKATNAAVVTAALAASANTVTAFGLAASTAAIWQNFVLESSAAIDANGYGAKAEFVWVSSDVFAKLAGFADTTGRPMFVVNADGVNSFGNVNVVAASGSIAGLPLVVDSGLPVRTAIVGAAEAVEVYESAGAPYRLSDENVINLTEDFSLYGYLAIAATNPKALAKNVLAA